MFSAFFRSLKQEFAGYNSKKLLADMMAGLTVCAVALPLALAFGVSSGASAAAGLVTAIIAGVVIAILGGRACFLPALPRAFCCCLRASSSWVA